MRAWRNQTRSVGKRRRKRAPVFTCGSCGKGYSNPLGHSCSGGGDMAKRRRAAERSAATAKRQADRKAQRARERERIAAVRQAERAKARERVAAARKSERAKAKAKRPGSSRPRPQKHDYRRCRDADCERVACEAWREGFDEGLASCTRPHA